MEDAWHRIWSDIVGRSIGPGSLRLIIQPTVATILAIRAGLQDAKEERPLYFWGLFTSRVERRLMLRSGWKDIGKLFTIAIAIDVVYQVLVFHRLYPVESILIALIVAVIPYICFRGLTNRFARRAYRDAKPAEEE
jgi:hypothetical protein